MSDELKNVWDNMHRKVFLLCLALSIGFITGAFFVPPMAVIDASVLAAVGELFAFASLACVVDGIERGHRVSMSKGDVNISIDKDDDDDGNDEDGEAD